MAVNDEGRLTDCLIEDEYHTDQRTGVEYLAWYFTCWADEGLTELIESVPGVTNAFNQPTKTRYQVYVDKRYDREWIKSEVEATVKIRGRE